ncbi:hypothetical protein E2C01_006433 [Portunus trituberculatus]|uniref:Uncharacterized protein n=1 Tax=Portunus trituberculatus TaxID=210409 RepID=A0A5B7CWV2_PORTR|nr:hypothetical protein [Portunus trituberculatus]
MGCARPNYEVHSRLTISFTNYYLACFGWPIYFCDPTEVLSGYMGQLDSPVIAAYLHSGHVSLLDGKEEIVVDSLRESFEDRFEPMRLETPQIPKRAWFHCTTKQMQCYHILD